MSTVPKQIKNKKKTATKKVVAPVGRPTDFTQDLADLICERIADGNSLRRVCREDESMPDMRSIFRWLRDRDEFSQQYARACEERTEAFAEDTLDIADNGVAVIKKSAEKKSGAVAQMVKLQVDTRKWHMSKMKPKKYGEHLDLTSDHKQLKGIEVLVRKD